MVMDHLYGVVSEARIGKDLSDMLNWTCVFTPGCLIQSTAHFFSYSTARETCSSSSSLLYPRFWHSLCVSKGYSGLGAWRGRGVWGEHGGLWRQQFQSLGNPAQLPANLQSALLLQGRKQHRDTYWLLYFYLYIYLILGLLCRHLSQMS